MIFFAKFVLSALFCLIAIPLFYFVIFGACCVSCGISSLFRR